MNIDYSAKLSTEAMCFTKIIVEIELFPWLVISFFLWAGGEGGGCYFFKGGGGGGWVGVGLMGGMKVGGDEAIQNHNVHYKHGCVVVMRCVSMSVSECYECADVGMFMSAHSVCVSARACINVCVCVLVRKMPHIRCKYFQNI
jgi:hypothetical protein